MNENEDIDDAYDYFGSYLKDREQQTKNLQNILEKSAKINFNQDIPDENVDFCGTFIDQIVELRTMREDPGENTSFLDHTHEIQQQLMATLDEEVAITKNTIDQELQEQQNIIEEQFQQSLREHQVQNDQNIIEVPQEQDDFLEQLQNDIQREEKYHDLAIKIQNIMTELLSIHDQQIAERQQFKLKNQQALQRIRSQYESKNETQKHKNIVLNKEVFKYNKESLYKQKQYKIGQHHKLIAKYYQELEQSLQQTHKQITKVIKRCLIDLVYQKPVSITFTDIIPQLISQNIGQYVVIANLSSQNLDQSVFNQIKVCKYLCELDLSNNQIEQLSVEHQFNNLQILKLDNNKISKINQNILQNMPILQQINLQNNQLEDDQIAMLLKLKYIRDLDISNNSVSNEFFNKELFSISLLTINVNTFMLSPEKMQMYLPNLIYMSIRGPIAKESYDNMQFLMPKLQIIHYCDVTDPRPSLDEAIYAKFKLPKLKRISDVDMKNIQSQNQFETILYKQEPAKLNIEKLYHTRKYVSMIQNMRKISLPNKFFSAIPQGAWDFNQQVQTLHNFFSIPFITIQNIDISTVEAKAQFTTIKRCNVLLSRSQSLQPGPQIVQVQSNPDMKIKLLLLPNILIIQRLYRKFSNKTKLYNLFNKVDVRKDLLLIKEILNVRNKQQQLQKSIQQHLLAKQIEDNKQKRLLELQELLNQVENEINNQEQLLNDINVVKNLLQIRKKQQEFKYQFIKSVEAKKVILKALKNHQFRNNLQNKLKQAHISINNKKKLITDLSNQYNFDDFDEDAVMAMTTRALNDLDAEFDEGLKEQLSNIVQEEQSKIIEKSRLELEIQPPKRPQRQVKPRQPLDKEKLKRPSSSTSDLRTSQLILDADSHIPGVLPPIQPTYDSSALITDSGLIDSELNDMSCIESMLVNSSASNTKKRSPVRARQPKVIIEPKQISPEKAMRTAQKDGWNFQDNNTAVAYYRMVQRQKRLARASKK